MPKVISLILGGGRGTRLYPLTKSRSKPAVPIAGKYRLIDIPISNCIHSGLNRIFVLTQFNSVSLHRHIANTYTFDPFGGGFVEILAAQQTMQHETWYQGTADAVRRNVPYFTEASFDLVLILSGDQLYRMDFQDMIRSHVENKAAVSIAALPVAEAEARSCGIMRIEAERPGDRLRGEAQDPRDARSRPDRARLDDPGSGSRPKADLISPAWGSTCSTGRRSSTCSPRATRPISARRSSPRPSPTIGSRPTSSTATGRTSAPSGPSTRRTST